MRVALVSPYSWSYPGGVMRHIEALGQALRELGHEVDVLAPDDPPGKLSERLHQGVSPQVREYPEWLTTVGRTVGIDTNSSMANLAITPMAVSRLRKAIEAGNYDIVHLHEPHAPLLGWDSLMSCKVPLVGTFHCYSDNDLTNGIGVAAGARRRLNRLVERIAVSEAAAWTGNRYYGGGYKIIPNGVDLPEPEQLGLSAAEKLEQREPGGLRFGFIGQAVERKGLGILLSAFAAVREQLPVELVLVGPEREEVLKLAAPESLAGVSILGRVSDEEKIEALNSMDMLVAPALGGESFGMVLTEAFAQGVPVIASNIVGYRDVVTDRRDGILVEPGKADQLARTMRDIALHPGRLPAMAEAASASAERFSWKRIATRVERVYESALTVPEQAGAWNRLAIRRGWKPADGRAFIAPRRVPPPGETEHRGRHKHLLPHLRRALVIASILATVVGSYLAIKHLGLEKIANTLVSSQPSWILLSLFVMVVSMAVRAVSWQAILRAAMPKLPVKLVHTLRATSIGVLMSATLPARLGEPARALLIARRADDSQRALPVVVGTLVSQTLINIAALLVLGAITISSIKVFQGKDSELIAVAAVPIVLVLIVLLAPVALRLGGARWGTVARIQERVLRFSQELRRGLKVFAHPRYGAVAVLAQFAAWGLQLLSCYLVLKALGIDEGFGAAAAVLLAVNVTAVLPATPSNVGVFQFACATVLAQGYGVSLTTGAGYGIVLQAVELATAFIIGMPAMLAEGVTWQDIRNQATRVAPVNLPPLPDRTAQLLARGRVEVD